MIEVRQKKISFLQFPRLRREERLLHAVSVRGKDPQRNMSFSVSNRHGDPVESRSSLLEALDLPLDRLVVAGQVHGAEVAVVERPPEAKDLAGRQNLLGGTDGLLTDRPGLPLLVTAADCPPIFFFDPKRGAVGLVHSGWRGTRAGISKAAIEKMKEAFGSEPKNLLAAIGPGIGPCCYEVGEDLVSQIEPEDRAVLRRNGERGRWILDLPAWIARQLEESGVPSSSIERSGLCTACDLGRFFSHRAEKGDTGRVAAVIALKG